MYVFCISKNKEPLGLVSPKQAKKLLNKGKAAVLLKQPFSLIMKEDTNLFNNELILKIDPGYKTTGLAIMDGDSVLFAAQIKHHAHLIKLNMESRKALRKGRRSRKTGYRKAKWLNRTRKDSWMPPSLQNIVSNVTTWVKRITKFCPIKEIWVEANKFDIRKKIDPTVSGKEYQQGKLSGYKNARDKFIKEDLVCFYCGKNREQLHKEGLKLQQDHFLPRSKGGSNSLRNFVPCCSKCNKEKGNKIVKDSRIDNKSFRAMTAMNQVKYRILESISEITDIKVMTFTGKQTYDNRLKYYGDIKDKDRDNCHWVDSVCVGDVNGINCLIDNVLIIESRGHGSRQMCITDKYGFPKTHRKKKKNVGIATGDIVKHKETNQTGIVSAARSPKTEKSKTSNIEVVFGKKKKSVTSAKLVTVQKSDGYKYSYQKPLFFPK